MTHRTWLEKFETGVIVTVITVLVWLYAEGENVQTFSERVMVRFVAPAGQHLAIMPRQPVQVVVGFRASAGEMSLLKEKLSQGPVPIEVAQDGDSQQPDQTIVIKDALESSPVGKLGINIIRADPATQVVRVETLETRTLPVTVPTSGVKVQFAKPPLTKPREVAVTMPSGLARNSGNDQVIAKIDDIDFTSYNPNSEQTISVPLEVPPDLKSPWTSLAVDTVQVTFNIRKLTDTIRLPNVPIRINTDPLTLQDFAITLSQDNMFLRDVRLTGPSDVIDAIRSGKTKVWAELRPTRDQAERGVKTLTPVIIVPDGVTFDPPPPIPVTITRR